MEKHRAVIVGAGRIGAGWNWKDDAYTHAGAYLALKERVELVGFVETDSERALAATTKWNLPCFRSVEDSGAGIVSVCVNPEQRDSVFKDLPKFVYGMWCEKPWVSKPVLGVKTQVNYLRRADPAHRELAKEAGEHNVLVVYGKDDETTRCHFKDLSRWWNVPLDYRPYNGPCAYALDELFFDVGGIDPGSCMAWMLENLLDAIDGKAELWSPPY